MSWPNFLTYIRIALIPFLVAIYALPLSPILKDSIAFIVFMAAAFTDWLDGYLARVLEQTSVFGAFLDPIADKLLVTILLVILVDLHRVSVLIASVIIGREIAISALREWMAYTGNAPHVAVSFLGKVKTAIQFFAISCSLLESYLSQYVYLHYLGSLAFYLAAFLTIISMIYYMKKALPYLK